jgi:hypothetical protein
LIEYENLKKTKMWEVAFSIKELWNNLEREGMGKQNSRATTSFTPDQFNDHFVSAVTGSHSSTIFNHEQSFGGFAFGLVDEDEVLSAVMSIKLDSLGEDGLPLKFVRFLIMSLFPSGCPKSWKNGFLINSSATQTPITCLRIFSPVFVGPTAVPRL